MPPSLAERLATGFRLHAAGRLDAAAEQARALLKRAPDLAGAHYLAGLVALDRNRPQQALRHLRDAAKHGPDNAALQMAMGDAALRSGEIIPAIAAAQRAVTLAPDHAPAHLLLADALSAKGDADAARIALDTLLTRDPTNEEAWHRQGLALRRIGRLPEAIIAFEKALSARPDWDLAASNLGGTLVEAGEAERAIPLLRQALQQAPTNRGAAHNLGLALDATGSSDAAAELFRALAAEGEAPAWLALGEIELRRDQVAAAQESFRQALKRMPRSVRAHAGLAEALTRAGSKADATAEWRLCLTLDPDDSVGAALSLSLLVGGKPPAAPTENFVRTLFDDYAGRFDEALTGKLHYRGPELLRAALAPSMPDNARWAMLDLGCGTGLAGAAFADCTSLIDGIDLSPRMIEQARARGLYRHLVADDLLRGMAGLDAGAYDLVLAADVLVYLGDLRGVFDGVARVLRPGGLFAFTIERRLESEDAYALLPSRRYAHGRSYILSLAESGFAVLRLDEVATRTDRGAPVPGLLCVTQRQEVS